MIMNNLNLSKSIYNKDSINRAIFDYKNFCRIEVRETNNYYLCSFYDCKYDMEKTMLEFENYLIDIINS